MFRTRRGWSISTCGVGRSASCMGRLYYDAIITRSHLTNGVPTRTRKHENAKTRNNLKVFFFVVSCFRGFVIVRVYETRSSLAEVRLLTFDSAWVLTVGGTVALALARIIHEPADFSESGVIVA